MREFIDNKLVIASNNDGKILELHQILKIFDIHILSNRDFNITEPIEDGKTFKENAYIKSFNTASKTKLVSLSDDSGISFRALNNRPGVHSARYAGKKKNFAFAFILISIEIIKELPITLILRPFNFETFSTKAFNMASSDLIEGAAIPSLFIILWSSLLIILSIKFFLRDQK